MADQVARDRYAEKLGDWRSAATGWIEAIDGVPVEGDPTFQQVTVYRAVDRTQFSFCTPSAVALHLNSAWKAAARAHALRAQVRLDPPLVEPGRIAFSVRSENTSFLFDYFEEMIIVAFGSFSALEAFCNQTIVEKAQGTVSVKRKKRHEQLAPEAVEREVSTTQKLSSIVPALLGVPSPTGKPVWGAFDRIKKLRDAVAHFKRRDQSSKVLAEPTVLYRLYAADCFSLPEDAMAVLRYFVPMDEEPRWMRNPGWNRPAATNTADSVQVRPSDTPSPAPGLDSSAARP